MIRRYLHRPVIIVGIPIPSKAVYISKQGSGLNTPPGFALTCKENKANLRDLIAATCLVILLKLD